MLIRPNTLAARVRSYKRLNGGAKARSPLLRSARSHNLRSASEITYFLLIAFSFIPYSVSTPLGFLSPVDFIAVLFLLSAGLKALSGQRIQRSNQLILIASGLTFLTVLLSQTFSSQGLNVVSPIVKYAIFLLFIPLGLYISGLNCYSGNKTVDVPATISWSGLCLAIFVLIQIARGKTQGGHGSYYVLLIDTYINKNELGNYFVFGTVAAAWKCLRDGRRMYIAFAIFQLAITAYSGARSSTICGAAGLLIVYLGTPRPSGKRLSEIALALGALTAFAVFVLGSGLFSDQLARFGESRTEASGGISSTGARLVLWPYAWSHILENPILGLGYGKFLYQSNDWMNGLAEPHNNVLQILYAGGWIGLLSFALLLSLSVLPHRAGRTASFMAICMIGYILNTFADIIWTRGVGHLFWILTFSLAFSPNRATSVLSAPVRAFRRHRLPGGVTTHEHPA